MSSQRSYTPAQHHMTFEDFGNGCRSKEKFSSKKHARGVARSMRQRGMLRESNAVLTPYRCRNCKRWHLGGTKNHGLVEGGREEWAVTTIEALAGAVRLGLVHHQPGPPRLMTFSRRLEEAGNVSVEMNWDQVSFDANVPVSRTDTTRIEDAEESV